MSQLDTTAYPRQGDEKSRVPVSLKARSLVQNYAIVAYVVAIAVAVDIWAPRFGTTTNLKDLLEQNASLGVAAGATTVVILTGQFDLSIGSVYALSGIVAAKLDPTIGAFGAFAIAVICGTVAGLVNGLLVTIGKINSFLATLATGIVINGLGVLLTGGFLVSVFDSSFQTLGTGEFAGLSYPVWVCFGVLLVLIALMATTTFGRSVHAVGLRTEVARLSGHRTRLVIVSAFMISATGAAVAGILDASNLGQGQAGTGADLTLTAIAAVAVGGTRLTGGRGSVWRTAAGVLLLGLLQDGFNLANLAPAYAEVAEAALIVIGGATSVLAQRRNR